MILNTLLSILLLLAVVISALSLMTGPRRWWPDSHGGDRRHSGR
jgi:hypothetical protein